MSAYTLNLEQKTGGHLKVIFEPYMVKWAVFGQSQQKKMCPPAISS